MENIILIRYGELNTKGKNSKMFINRLASNIKLQFKDYPKIKLTYNNSRMYLSFNDYQVDEITNRLQNVFGIYSFSIVKKIACDYEILKETILNDIDFSKYKTFKVVTKRADKAFIKTTNEVNIEIGSM
ncbi:MAG: tRNA uracil 4-sulfurtransferase ThiI, partial [Bacilli bacterium]